MCLMDKKTKNIPKNDVFWEQCSFRALVGPYAHILWSSKYVYCNQHSKWVWESVQHFQFPKNQYFLNSLNVIVDSAVRF